MFYNHIMKRIKIKICGQTNLAIIDHVLQLGVDYQGLIFYSESPRFVNEEILINIRNSFNEYQDRFVGVFVDPTFEEISSKLDFFNFGSIQLHGNETQDFINECKKKFNKPIFKSIYPNDFSKTILQNIDYYLIDSKPSRKQMPGGNNSIWDWTNFNNTKKLPFILSGGLNSSNIKDAIRLTGANFIDINSGVEVEPGEKTLTLIEELISLIHK